MTDEERTMHEAWVEWAMRMGFSTGHADTMADLQRELSEQIWALREKYHDLCALSE